MNNKTRFQHFRPLKIGQRKINEFHFNLQGSWVAPYIQQLLTELKARQLNFKPSFWISTEWFSPADRPGIALPFYLFDSQLIQYHKQKLGFTEGATPHTLMKYLRHEAGHAIDHAFALNHLPRRKDIFGDHHLPYPISYDYKPFSSRFVRHLGEGYAQAHPEEDWAETFAVWLGPKIHWQKRYQGTQALEKLNFMDQTMKGLREKRPLRLRCHPVDPYQANDLTLDQFYRLKRQEWGPRVTQRQNYQGILTPRQRGESSPCLFKRKTHSLRSRLSRKHQVPLYLIDRMINEVSRHLKVKNLSCNDSVRLQALYRVLDLEASHFFQRRFQRVRI